MASFVIHKSPFNSLPMVPENYRQNGRYNTVQPGTDWYINTLGPGMVKAPYQCPAMMADRWAMQFWISECQAVELMLVKVIAKGYISILHSWTPTQTVYLAGAAITVGSQVIPVDVYHFAISPSLVPGLKQGTYYLRLKVGFSEADNGIADTWAYDVSEPIRIRNSQPGTVWIDSSNNENDYDTEFVNTRASFGWRTEGALHGYNPNSTDTSFTNEAEEVTKLYSQPYDTYKLTAGGKQGIPDHMRQRANFAMAADRIVIDGRRFSKEDKAKWEPVDPGPEYPLGGASIAIRPARMRSQYSSILKTGLVLYTAPGAYPYFIHTLSMTDGTRTVTLPGPYVVNSSADETALADLINGQYAVTSNLNGNAVFAGGKLKYFPAEEEEFDTVTVRILPYHVAFTLTPSGGVATDIAIDIVTAPGYAGIDWAGAGVERFGDGATSPTEHLVHQFPPSITAPVTVQLFHADQLIHITTSSPKITAVSGLMPASLQELDIEDTGITAFDAAMLFPSVGNLAQLSLTGNQLTGVTNFNQPFGALQLIYFNENNIGSTNIDSIINQFVTASNYASITGGVMQLQDQGVSAHPTSASSSAGLLLFNAGWTLTTD